MSAPAARVAARGDADDPRNRPHGAQGADLDRARLLLRRARLRGRVQGGLAEGRQAARRSGRAEGLGVEGGDAEARRHQDRGVPVRESGRQAAGSPAACVRPRDHPSLLPRDGHPGRVQALSDAACASTLRGDLGREICCPGDTFGNVFEVEKKPPKSRRAWGGSRGSRRNRGRAAGSARLPGARWAWLGYAEARSRRRCSRSRLHARRF